MVGNPEQIDDVETPELTEAAFARAKPSREVFPEAHEAWKKCYRPRSESPKVHIGFRLAANVVEDVRATGKGYNARVERVLRKALAEGELWRLRYGQGYKQPMGVELCSTILGRITD